MRAAAVPTLALSLVSLCLVPAAPLAGDEEVRIRSWAAPPFWNPQPPAARGPGEDPDPAEAPAPAALPSGALPFFAVAPCRLVDTRGAGSPWVGDWGPPALLANTPRTFAIPAGPCPGIPADAAAYSLNFTVFGEPGVYQNAFLSAWPTGSSQPTVSTLNFSGGQLSVNAAVVPAGTGGSVDVLVAAGAHLILDVNGYYAPQAVVNTVNGLSGAVTLSPGAGIGIAPSGNTLTISSSGASPTGPAGGGLAGTYPNPTIAANAVSAGNIAGNQVVKSVNGFKDAVTVQGGGGVTVTNAANVVTIAAPAGSMILGEPGDTTLIGQGYSEVGPSSVEYWRPTGASPLSPRFGHTAVWTGSRLLVWGGQAGFNNSAFDDGAAYDPATDSWSPLASTGAPAPRKKHSAVWTGSVMIVWGGTDAPGTKLSTGGVYNPAGSGSWSATRTTGAPSAREDHTAVWVGGTMVIWGGYNGGGLSTGGRYSPPPANSWLPTNVLVAPSARFGHTAVAAGSTMLVWGGTTGASSLDDGSEYDPSTDSWSAIGGAPAWLTERAYHTAVWTGSAMVVFGGVDSAGAEQPGGGVWTRSSNSWERVTSEDAPIARAYHAAVWTGSRMLVWSGKVGQLAASSYLASGGAYDPGADSWVPLTSVGAPTGRIHFTAAWTGSKLVVWGGYGREVLPTDTGGVWSHLSIYAKY